MLPSLFVLNGRVAQALYDHRFFCREECAVILRHPNAGVTETVAQHIDRALVLEPINGVQVP
jgi:hypothetical protein